MMKRLARFVTENRVWRSVFRQGFPDTNRKRSLAILSTFVLHFHPAKVRLRAIRFERTFYLGGLSAACMLILTITGVLLMFYYRPATPQAYHDIEDLGLVVSLGWFLRNLHRWAAHAMVGLVLLHMVWTFYRGAYRPPREFNWVVGVVLLLLTILLSYTGYLLPWDQLAYWAVTVGSHMIEAIPAVGSSTRTLLLGGGEIDGTALLRFYVLHCVVLPALLFGGIGLHIWRIRKDGGIYLPRSVQPGEPGEAPQPSAPSETTEASEDEAVP